MRAAYRSGSTHRPISDANEVRLVGIGNRNGPVPTRCPAGSGRGHHRLEEWCGRGRSFQAAVRALDIGNQFVEVNIAGCCQDDVLRAVAAVEIVSHRVGRHLANGFRGAEHSPAQAAWSEVHFHRPLESSKRWLVFVLGDLFQDHLPFGFKLVFVK